MGIGVKVSCPCFGSFTLQVGFRHPSIACFLSSVPSVKPLLAWIFTPNCWPARTVALHPSFLMEAHLRSVNWGQRQYSHAGLVTSFLPTS